MSKIRDSKREQKQKRVKELTKELYAQLNETTKTKNGKQFRLAYSKQTLRQMAKDQIESNTENKSNFVEMPSRSERRKEQGENFTPQYNGYDPVRVQHPDVLKIQINEQKRKDKKSA